MLLQPDYSVGRSGRNTIHQPGIPRRRIRVVVLVEVRCIAGGQATGNDDAGRPAGTVTNRISPAAKGVVVIVVILFNHRDGQGRHLRGPHRPHRRTVLGVLVLSSQDEHRLRLIPIGSSEHQHVHVGRQIGVAVRLLGDSHHHGVYRHGRQMNREPAGLAFRNGHGHQNVGGVRPQDVIPLIGLGDLLVGIDHRADVVGTGGYAGGKFETIFAASLGKSQPRRFRPATQNYVIHIAPPPVGRQTDLKVEGYRILAVIGDCIAFTAAGNLSGNNHGIRRLIDARHVVNPVDRQVGLNRTPALGAEYDVHMRSPRSVIRIPILIPPGVTILKRKAPLIIRGRLERKAADAGHIQGHALV